MNDEYQRREFWGQTNRINLSDIKLKAFGADGNVKIAGAVIDGQYFPGKAFEKAKNFIMPNRTPVRPLQKAKGQMLFMDSIGQMFWYSKEDKELIFRAQCFTG